MLNKSIANCAETASRVRRWCLDIALGETITLVVRGKEGCKDQRNKIPTKK